MTNMPDRPIMLISHTKANKEQADKLFAYLEYATQMNFNIIYTLKASSGIPGGENVLESLRSCIRKCVAVWGILSGESFDSSWVMFELGAAWGFEKHIVPLLLPGMSASDLPTPIDKTSAVVSDSPDITTLLMLATENICKKNNIPYTSTKAQEHLEALVESLRNYKNPGNAEIDDSVKSEKKNENPLAIKNDHFEDTSLDGSVYIDFERVLENNYTPNNPHRFECKFEISYKAIFLLFIEACLSEDRDQKYLYDILIENCYERCKEEANRNICQRYHQNNDVSKSIENSEKLFKELREFFALNKLLKNEKKGDKYIWSYTADGISAYKILKPEKDQILASAIISIQTKKNKYAMSIINEYY